MKTPFYTTNRIVRITLYWLCFLFLSLIMVGIGQMTQLHVNSAHLLKVHHIQRAQSPQIKTVMIDSDTALCVYKNHENITFDPSHEKALCAARIRALDMQQSIEEAQQHLIPAWPLSLIMNTHKDK